MNYTGYIQSTITPEHYVLGGLAVPTKVVRSNGNWSFGLPEVEYQNRTTFDTFNCTGFNTLNQIETYMRVVFGGDYNYSDRWVGIIAGTRPPGNDPQTVYEAIRKHGLIPEEMLPFDADLSSVEEYYSFKHVNEAECRAEGQRWLQKYDLLHEWVFSIDQPWDEKKNNMKVALKYSPLALAVYAWTQDEKGVYIRLGNDCHWTFCYNYDDLQRIFDSYDPALKPVDQEIFYCKRIHIDLKTQIKQSWWQTFITNLFRYLHVR